MNHVSPVRDQKRCAACWAFSTVAAVESAISIKRGQMLDLSEQMLIDCNPNYYGCAGGYPPFAMEFIRTFGVSKEDEYQYNGIEGKQCLMSPNKTRIFIDGYTLLEKNEDTIADWIVSNGPVSFLMSFTRSMYTYRSGIFHPSPEECVKGSIGSHGMTIVGYGVSLKSKYWIVKNSWGVKWGENGHRGLDLGITEFSDWADSELREFLVRKIDENLETLSEAIFDLRARPKSFDWRESNRVTPIRSQGVCGSCWAFSTVAAVESVISIKTGKLVDLSTQELLDCDKHQFGCKGGYTSYAMKFVKKHGLCRANDYPYIGFVGSQCLVCNKTRFFIDDYAKLTNEDLIANWIYQHGPATFSMNITKSLFSYHSGIFQPKLVDCQENSLGSHAMTLIGYGETLDSQPYWIVKNSWGLHWGEEGYMRLARGVNICGMANRVVAPIMK